MSATWSPPRECVALADGVRSHTFLALLYGLQGLHDDHGARRVIDRFEHSVQTASRAAREHADDELVIVALLHDSLSVLAPASHSSALAEALADRLTPNRTAILRHHDAFTRDAEHSTACAAQFRLRPWFDEATRLAAWDVASFDPRYDALPVGMFIPALRRLLD